MKTMKEAIVSGIAIIIIGALAGIALFKGLDGTMLLGAITIIAGLAGYQVGKRQVKKDSTGEPPK